MTDLASFRRFRAIGARLVLALCAGALVLGLLPVARGAAAPIDDDRAEAQRLEAQINDTSTQIAALYEQIKFNQDAADAAQQKVVDTEAAIDAARSEVQRVTTLVRERAVVMYQRSGRTGLEAFQTEITDVASRSKYAKATGASDNNLLDKLAGAKAHLDAVRDDAAAARDAADARAEELQQQQATFDTMQQEQEQLLAQVNGEIGRLVAEEQAKRAAAEAPAVIPAVPTAAATTPASTGPADPDAPSTPVSAAPDPAPQPAPGSGSGRGAAVVAYAAAQLGTPYCYAGTGPDCFDCSGLTMQAWAQVGVAMAHNSEAQFASFRQVPMNALLPGDIVWTPGHVGIYVGDGAVIHAPHTGDVVRYISVGYFQAAVRPG